MRRSARALDARGVKTQEDEEQDGEREERGAAVAEEGQGDAYHGGEAKHHADVNHEVECEYAYHAVAVDADEAVLLPFGKGDEAVEEYEIDYKHARAAHEAPLFTDSAENEVRVLLRHIFELGLRALHEAFA